MIEPFVGNGDLLQLFPHTVWEKYDLESDGDDVIIQDTLKNPPDYTNKWVITNPPYLAKNKTTDKEIFNTYNTDDLYKASLYSIMNCLGGIIIIPTNFFTDEGSYEIRKQFLDNFIIKELNIFTEPVFNSTTYSVCSFAFWRKEKPISEPQTILTNICPKNTVIQLTLYSEYNYRLAGEFFAQFENIDCKFGRLMANGTPHNITNIKLYALDTRQDRIRLEFCKEPFYGKNTDRTYATLVCPMNLTEEQEKELIHSFNTTLEQFRQQYFDLSLTNYRDFNRKRIGFTFAYQLLTKIYNDLYQE